MEGSRAGNIVSFDEELNQERAHQLIDERLSYHQWARAKLNDSSFHSEADRLIWEHHSEGLSSREISPRIGYDQSWVVRKLTRIKKMLIFQDMWAINVQKDWSKYLNVLLTSGSMSHVISSL